MKDNTEYCHDDIIPVAILESLPFHLDLGRMNLLSTPEAWKKEECKKKRIMKKLWHKKNKKTKETTKEGDR